MGRGGTTGSDGHGARAARGATALGSWAELDAALRDALSPPAACPFCGDHPADALGELIVSLAAEGPALDGACADCGAPLPRRR